MNPSLFSSLEYVLYRFEYPEALFRCLRSSSLVRVLDVGCGTGLVSTSLMKALPLPLEISLMDVDSEMLKVAKERLSGNPLVQDFKVAAAESIPFESASFDLVVIGSAWHWMRQEQSVSEILRVLRPGGSVFVFEYQFPKAVANEELNEWIRTQFNQKWKPATQVPRGNLHRLTECWRSHVEFSQVSDSRLVTVRGHDAAELAGVIISQSRYQHFEQSLSDTQKLEARENLRLKIQELMGKGMVDFQYSYEGYLFKKRR